jgi:hypothetical protein
MRAVLKRNGARHNAGRTIKLVGCSANQLKQYLEAAFVSGMNWGNYGQWHVDHIKPCASFNLTQPEQQLACFHYTNLQPLWGPDNLRKGARQSAQQAVQELREMGLG